MKRFTAGLLLLVLVLMPGVILSEEGITAASDGNIEYVILKYGVDSQAVTDLQTKLTELYYYTGNISGRYREGTQAAVKRFQEDYGLEATGIADPDTQAALFAAKYRPLEKGKSGEDVKALQRRLTELTYYHGQISGNFLEGTFSATHTFQERNGLLATGKADVKTLELLYSDAAIAKNVATPSPTPRATPAPNETTPTPGPNDIIVEDDYVIDSYDTAQEVPYKKQLSSGASGDLVKQLQQRLTDLGYYEGPVSGNFAGQTKTAVKAFQKNNAITEDGIVGKITWNLIFNDPNMLSASATPRPTPEPTPIPFALTIDVQNQIVNVYGRNEEGEYADLVRQMICSTGVRGWDSDLGDWVLNGRTARWAYFPRWGSHAQYWTRINSSIAFHSVIYNTPNEMDLSISSYNKLGSRASHGCIRLLVHDAKWVYENVGEGTVVTITDSLPSDPELTKSLKPGPLNKGNMLPSRTPEPTALPEYDGSKPPDVKLRTLKNGSQGEDVYWLQMRLRELGYYQGTVTGSYYAGTTAAVKAYQKDHGLGADGVAGTKTLNTIYENIGTDPVYATPAPTEKFVPTPTPGPTPTPSPTPNPYIVTDDE